MEKTMSLRIAAALAVTIGAGIVMSSPAQARPEMVGMHSAEYSPGTIVVKTGERRLYLILDSDILVNFAVSTEKLAPASDQAWKVALLIGFLAGFMERLVPDLLENKLAPAMAK